MHIKPLNRFSVPDIGSSVIPVSSVVSVGFSLTVMVSEDTVGKKQKFAFTNASSELTETLH